MRIGKWKDLLDRFRFAHILFEPRRHEGTKKHEVGNKISYFE